MSFFGRIANYLLNEVLVNTLANSRVFQRFAIRSSSMVDEMAKKTAQQKGQVASQSAEVLEKGSEFFRHFRQELTKGLTDIQNAPRK